MNRSGLVILSITISCLSFTTAACQSGLPEKLLQQEQSEQNPAAYFELRQEAQTSFEAADYRQAAALYGQLSRWYPEDGENWLNLGLSQYSLQNYSDAAESLQRARAHGHGPLTFSIDQLIAAAHARAGQPESALEWLSSALYEQRSEHRSRLLRDPSFAALRDDPRFRFLAGAPRNPALTREDGWRGDVDYLLAEVRRLNAEYSLRSLPDSITAAAESLKEQVPTLGDAEIAVGLQRILVMLGHTHNGWYPWAEGARVQFTQLPVMFYVFPDGIYVIDASSAHRDLVGTRVVAFDDTPADDVLDAVGQVLDRENEMELVWRGPYFMAMPQVLHALGVTQLAGRVDLTVQDRQGVTRRVELEAVPLERRRKLVASRLEDVPPPPAYLRRVEEPFWFEIDTAADLVYVQVNQISNSETETLAHFGIRLRNLIKQQEPRHLVLDLRNNNGGSVYLYPELLRTLVAFDARDDRSLFVLIGRNTFSAAQNLIVDLERLTNAIFVGEPSGGKPNTHGNEAEVVLPYSGLHFGLSAVYWQQSSPRDQRNWIAPHVPVTLSAGEYFANQDPAMDIVRQLIQSRTDS
jgi:tetratricopeptide (TPR) repeat protein